MLMGVHVLWTSETNKYKVIAISFNGQSLRSGSYSASFVESSIYKQSKIEGTKIIEISKIPTRFLWYMKVTKKTETYANFWLIYIS